MTISLKLAARLRKSCIPALALLAGCHPKGGDLDIVLAADQMGYLAPCGCSQAQLGGAARAVAFLRTTADAGPTIFVEGGNFLFEAPMIPAEARPEATEKGAALSQSWQLGLDRMRAVAWGVGPLDSSLGPELQAQLLAGVPLLSAPRVLAAGAVRIGVLPLAGPSADRAAADSLRSQGASLVLAVVQGARVPAAQWAASAGADAALQVGVVDPVIDNDEKAQLPAPGTNGVALFRVKDKGRGLLVLHLHVPQRARPGLAQAPALPVWIEGPDARQARAADLDSVLQSRRKQLEGASGPLRDLLTAKIAELETRRAAVLAPPPPPPPDQVTISYRFVDLAETQPEDPAAAAIFARYTKAIGAKNLAAQAQKECPAPAPGQAHYMGVESCKTCHAEAYDVYAGTKHPHAYATLVQKERQYDLDCIACHVVGYGKPGGVCRLDRVPADGSVQCESCHGMGSAHVQSGGDVAVPIAKPGFDTCYSCHDPKNDTRFNRDTFKTLYLPAVLGPGHGQPLAARKR